CGGRRICTFRDKTEVSQLLQRLDGMMSYVDALRTTSHAVVGASVPSAIKRRSANCCSDWTA
ncbi:hypothetical protein CKJ89_39350, partial [Klebsiella pneumoniae]